MGLCRFFCEMDRDPDRSFNLQLDESSALGGGGLSPKGNPVMVLTFFGEFAHVKGAPVTVDLSPRNRGVLRPETVGKYQFLRKTGAICGDGECEGRGNIREILGKDSNLEILR